MGYKNGIYEHIINDAKEIRASSYYNKDKEIDDLRHEVRDAIDYCKKKSHERDDVYDQFRDMFERAANDANIRLR